MSTEIRHHQRQHDLTNFVARQQNTFFGWVIVKMLEKNYIIYGALSMKIVGRSWRRFTSCLAFEFELFLERRQGGDGITEEHGLKEAQETVGQQVRFLRSEFLEPSAFERTESTPGVFIFVQ